MKHTDAEIEEAARRFEALADALDPATAQVEDLADLRAIAEAAERTRRDKACAIGVQAQLVTIERVPVDGEAWGNVPGLVGCRSTDRRAAG